MVASNVNSFNISGLTPRTITEYDSNGNIIPSEGTYNMVSKIDTEISS